MEKTNPQQQNETIDWSKYDKSTHEFTFKGTCTYARVVSLYDGDTMNVVFPYFNNFFKFSLRLNRIDTSEMRSENTSVQKLAIEARNVVFNLITGRSNIPASKKEIDDTLNTTVFLVWIECMGFDKWGRILAEVKQHKESTHNFSDILLQKGLAYQYYGGTKLTESAQESKLSKN